jgi:hypothetical protein
MGLEVHIDAMTSSGYIEGWAHYPDSPGVAVELSIMAKGRVIGGGFANRYRWDLADIGCGLGWCAFRLRVEGAVSVLRRGPLVLLDVAQNASIEWAGPIAVIEDAELRPQTLDEVSQADPTVLFSIDQLRGCHALFERYLQTKGAEQFVRAAYVYMLSRPVDSDGLVNYVEQLRSGLLLPYGVLDAIHNGFEFRSAKRLLCAPTQPGFIFNAP